LLHISDVEVITLTLLFLLLLQCKMDGSDIEKDVIIPQMKGKRLQGNTEK